MKMAGKKRKKNSIVDEGNMKPKKSGKLEDKKEHSRVVEEGDNEHVGTALQKKDTTKPWKKKFNVSKGSKQIKTKKRLGALKNVEMHKVKSPSNANRTETLDKKHEARRKRRAKGKVRIMWFSWNYVPCLRNGQQSSMPLLQDCSCNCILKCFFKACFFLV